MHQKIAVITGAGSGIGRAAAVALLNDGYAVALAGRHADTLQATAAMATAGEAMILPTDVTQPDAVAALFAAVEKRHQRLDVLFNNAGIFAPVARFGDIDYAAWQAVIDVNIHGMFLCAQHAFRLMRKQTPRGGRIINNGSVSAHVPRPRAAAYTTSKHAITGLTKSIALDGREHGIVCSQIDIGNAATDMTQAMSSGVLQADGETRAEPVMNVENVAATLLLMANMSLDANIQFVTVMASNMPYIGRG